MTAIDYVKENLQRDYGEAFENIINGFDTHLDEMMDADGPTEGELNYRFQHLLDEMLYPFLACMKAMKGAGIPAEEADAYCRKLVEDMPKEICERAAT